MKMKKTVYALMSGMILTGIFCGTAAAEDGGEKHEPLTITYSSGIDALEALVQESYPEIDLEVYPYTGRNWSRFTCDQMITGEMPDIYNTTLAWLNYPEEMKAHLLDLSSYAFTDLYDPNLLAQQEVDGGLYLLPGNYYVYSLAYNATLFEEHGWKVPESFEELEALAPEIEAAGVDLASTNTDSAGQGFQYMCNLADTIDLTSLKGVKWQRDFLSGNATAEEGFGEAMDYMQKWIDLGMLEGSEARGGRRGFEVFTEGNTAFMVGGVDRWTQNEDGTGDRYEPMPYLSMDGTNNMYITMMSKNFGLSAKLAEPGNEQKLEDALHVMEVLSTFEGQNTFNNYNSSSISSLRGWTIDEANPLAPCMELLQAGQSAPLLYTGWEGFLAEVGGKVLDYLNGKCTGDDVLALTDELCAKFLENGAYSYSEVDRSYSGEETAMLTGRIFGDAVGADCALISVDRLQADGRIQDGAGICGYMMPLPLTDERIVSVIPTGWNGTIQTVTLSGKQINEYMEKGYVVERDGETAVFPYVLVTKGGEALKDDTEYTVVVCGADEEMSAAGNITDSGVVGLQAFKDFFEDRGNPPMSEELLNWD